MFVFYSGYFIGLVIKKNILNQNTADFVKSNERYLAMKRGTFFICYSYVVLTISSTIGIITIFNNTDYIRERLIYESINNINRDELLEKNKNELFNDYPFVESSEKLISDHDIDYFRAQQNINRLIEINNHKKEDFEKVGSKLNEKNKLQNIKINTQVNVNEKDNQNKLKKNDQPHKNDSDLKNK